MDKVGNMGSVGGGGFLAWRDCNIGLGAIVCFDCNHSFDARISILVFGCLKKTRTPYRADLRIFVDFFERFFGSITALRSHVQCSTYHMYASGWAATASLVVEPNSSLKMAVAIDR